MNTMDLYALNHIPEHMAYCYSRETIYQMDKLLIEEHQLPLMERAGRYAAYCIRQHFPDIKKIAVFAGSGNNGGDAWICARHLQLFGIEVHCFYTSVPKTPMAKAAYEEYLKTAHHPSTWIEASLPELDGFDLIVDGLLGIGINQPLRGEIQTLINYVNSIDTPVFSLDIPSGLNSETGLPQPVAIMADHTLVFLGLKTGLLTSQGRNFSGAIEFSSLHVPEKLYDEQPKLAKLAIQLPDISRPMDSHKGLFGEIHIIGGTQSMAGAVLLCGQAAQRTGAGLVRILTHPSHVNQLTSALPEAIFHEADAMLPNSPDVKVIGPGLGEDAWGEALFHQHIQTANVVDASALNWLAKYPQRSEHWILTPHPKEAARLLNCEVDEIQSDRIEAAKALAKQYGGWVILKGSGTIISNATDAYLCPYGNPAMASAGMGDVLCGVVASLLSSYQDLERAATQAVSLHAHTADQLMEQYGWGLQASDVAKKIRINVAGFHRIG